MRTIIYFQKFIIGRLVGVSNFGWSGGATGLRLQESDITVHNQLILLLIIIIDRPLCPEGVRILGWRPN